MQDFVVHANVERFERLIEAETDMAKAKVLRILLAQEKAKLALPRDLSEPPRSG